MIRIYKTSEATFVLSRKQFKDTVPAIGRAETVGEAFDRVMDEHYTPSKGVSVKYDKDLKDAVLESGIPDVDEKDFINVTRYL